MKSMKTQKLNSGYNEEPERIETCSNKDDMKPDGLQ
jgi:hypothetical protein